MNLLTRFKRHSFFQLETYTELLPTATATMEMNCQMLLLRDHPVAVHIKTLKLMQLQDIQQQ